MGRIDRDSGGILPIDEKVKLTPLKIGVASVCLEIYHRIRSWMNLKDGDGENMPKFIFVPKMDGNLQGLLSDIQVARQRAGKVPYTVLSGDDCLEDVRAGDVLYVFGHGNLGKGLGPVISQIPATDLADMLLAEFGLKDLNFVVKLLACNSGATMPGFEEDYAKKFANALCLKEYRNILIDGYVGFVMPTNSPKLTATWISLDGEDETKAPQIWENTPIKSKTSEDVMRVRYSIKSGFVEQLGSAMWRVSKTVEDGVTDYKVEKI